MTGPDSYVDFRGDRFPAFAPGAIYLGSLRKGRVCFDHNGSKLKVINQSFGSVTVKRSGRTAVIGEREFRTSETIPLARSTVVTLKPGGAPVGAPPTPGGVSCETGTGLVAAMQQRADEIRIERLPEITKIDDDIYQCADCGSWAETESSIEHHETCVPGTAEKWANDG